MSSSLQLYLQPKLITIGLLGFVSGVPLALTLSTLTVWLTEVGVTRTAIGLFAVITTPYALKFLWSPLIDQMKLPYITSILGRRRGWMITLQCLLIASIIGLGCTHPDISLWWTALMAFMVALLSASQDIVIDAYRIELLDDDQQGAGAAIVVFGYRVGMLVSSAGALFLASYVSWFVTYAVMACCILIGIITVWIAGEPNDNKLEETKENRTITEWFYGAVICPFSEFMTRPSWIAILLLIILYKFGDAFAGVMTNPFLIETGFSKAEIATVVKTFGLGATLLGAFIGGSLIHRMGLYRSLLLCGILQMLSNLAFVVQAYVGYDVSTLTVVIGLENFSGGMGTAAFVAFISRLCHVNYTATQYALLSSLAVAGRTWLSASSGWVVDMSGWPLFFIFSTLLAVPGVLLLIGIKKEVLLWLKEEI